MYKETYLLLKMNTNPIKKLIHNLILKLRKEKLPKV